MSPIQRKILDSLQQDNVEVLLKIAENILKNPANPKVRVLHKHNLTFQKKILSNSEAVNCLKYMGFVERKDCYEMPQDSSLSMVTSLCEGLRLWKASPQQSKSDARPSTLMVKRVVLPDYVPVSFNDFLRSVELNFHKILQHEDKALKERARSLIPIEDLTRKSLMKLRQLQGEVKKNKIDEPDCSVDDILLLELLNWFKEDFFTWVNSPACEKCGAETQMSHLTEDPKLLLYTKRVEMHFCKSCKELTPFPRYEDLNILLETRRGRCGEWANVFTLFCRALKWDARFVVEEGDHVWTEVFSSSQKRWIHCDPCENIADSPLIYETGWKKDISYVMAYSCEEVQDVTWRYSSNHKEVLKRRRKCPEEDLLNLILKLREQRQKKLSKARKYYLTKRVLYELAELMTEKKSGDKEEVGRTSGSLSWRLDRGETTKDLFDPYVWKLNCKYSIFKMQYSCSLDQYELWSHNTLVHDFFSYSCGIFQQSNVFRKTEPDWKMCYLCRKNKETCGFISWKFEVEGHTKKIDLVKVTFPFKTFASGVVSLQLISDDLSESFEESTFETSNFQGKTSLTLSANLSGGEGAEAWQHAQLLRQSLSSPDYNMVVEITLK